MQFSKLDRTELEFVTGLLFKSIEVIPKSEYNRFLPEASKLIPEKPEDVPCFAQSKVKVFITDDIFRLLKKPK